MVFQLVLGEVQLWCSSPGCLRKHMEAGAHLVDPARADDLRRVLGAALVPPPVAAAASPAD